MEHPPNDGIKYSYFPKIRYINAMFFSLRSCKYKILSWYCFMVGLGEISIFDILILKNEHQTAINQARRFTWRRILRFASFTQFYRHQPRITTIYRDFTVIFMVWTRSLIFIVDLDGFQINVLIDEFLVNQNMAMVITVNQRPRFKRQVISKWVLPVWIRSCCFNVFCCENVLLQ